MSHTQLVISRDSPIINTFFLDQYTLLSSSHEYMGQVTKLWLSCYWFCYQLIAKPGNKTAAVP